MKIVFHFDGGGSGSDSGTDCADVSVAATRIITVAGLLAAANHCDSNSSAGASGSCCRV